MSRHAPRRYEPRHAPQGALPISESFRELANEADAVEDAPVHPGVAFPHKIGVAPVRRLSLLAMIDDLGKDDPALARVFATVAASAADFRRVIDALPADLPADVRAVVDAVLERL